MTNINIQQSTSAIENVSSKLIDKLYKLALNSKVADPVNKISMQLSGNLSASAAYQDAVDFLTAKFPNLIINIRNNNYYVRFEDSIVENIITSRYSTDKIGLSKTDLQANMVLDNVFGNRNIETLKDLKNITGNIIQVHAICSYSDFRSQLEEENSEKWDSANRNNPILYYPPGHPEGMDIEFSGKNYSGGVQILQVLHTNDSANSHLFGGTHYKIKYIVNSVKWNGVNITPQNAGYIGYIYRNCQLTWNDSLIPDLTDLSQFRYFVDCNIDKIIFREGIVKVLDNFSGCVVTNIVYPSTIQNVGQLFTDFRRDSGLWNTGNIVIKAVNPPSMTTTYISNCVWPQSVYVPDNSVNAYKTSSTFPWNQADVIKLIKPMSEMPSNLREELGITQEDINRT